MSTLSWSDWMPLAEAVAAAPRDAGVYEARSRATGEVVYVGEGGKRRNGRGVDARLNAYLVGKSPDAGLIAKAVNLALSDVGFIGRMQDAAASGNSWTIKRLAQEAMAHAELEFRFALAPDNKGAEKALLAEHRAAGVDLWNNH